MDLQEDLLMDHRMLRRALCFVAALQKLRLCASCKKQFETSAARRVLERVSQTPRPKSGMNVFG